jgi:hypothetical protein
MRATMTAMVFVMALGCSNESGPPYACERNADCPGHDEVSPQCMATGGCVTPRAGCDTRSGFCLSQCAADADCEPGQVCWSPGGVGFVCAWPCEDGGACPSPFVCGVQDTGQRCDPADYEPALPYYTCRVLDPENSDPMRRGAEAAWLCRAPTLEE